MPFRIFVLILMILPLRGTTFGQKEISVIQKKPFVIGETVQITSNVLGEDRTLNIYLPQSYSQDTLKNYPVIYLLDGSRNEDFIHISGLVQFGSFSWINFIPETIVVGIRNIDRKRDFTYPSNNERDLKELPTSGKSEDFISFIQNEVQPFIALNYRTNSVKTIIGQSLGGLLATEILFKHPNSFDNFIIVSPSLWWDDESLLKLIPENYETDKSIYIAVGKEGPLMERIAMELYDKLKNLNNANTNLYFKHYESQNHGDALHLAVYEAFEKIFKTAAE